MKRMFAMVLALLMMCAPMTLAESGEFLFPYVKNGEQQSACLQPLEQPAAPTREPAATPAPELSSAAPAIAGTLMMDYANLPTEMYVGVSSYVLGSEIPRKDIHEVHFVNTTDIPAYAWDVSEAKDGSVNAWMEENAGRKALYIGADGKIQAPEDCYAMFFGYANAEIIDFGGTFITDQTTNMMSMFRDCNRLRMVDVSGFDTSKVTNMSWMFSGCGSLIELDVSGFDTSNVTDMKCLFRGCRSLTNLDLSGFDTSNVASMNKMFNYCTSLTALDLSSFVTSGDVDMNSMFRNCPNLGYVLADSSFQLPTGKNDDDMFKKCGASEITIADSDGVISGKGTIKYAQKLLNDLGYNCGTPDGIIGPKTSGAIASFRQDHGLGMGEELTKDTFLKLISLTD